MTRIDVHAHCFPAAYLDLLERHGSTFTPVARHTPCSGNAPEDIAQRLETMDASGVDVQVLSAVPQMPTFDNRDHAVEVARAGNDMYADLLADHPGRFLALADVPLPHGDAAAEEAARAMDELGFVGACVPTSVGERTLGDPSFEPLWAALHERGGVLFVHAAGQALNSPFLADQMLRWMVGAPIEDGVGLLHLVRSGVMQKYPGIKIVSSHMGGPVPLLAERIEHYWTSQHERSGFPESPTAMWRRMWFDTVNYHRPSLRLALDTVGADRLVLGTDFPYSQKERYAEAVDAVAGSDLDAGTKEKILATNALEGLGLRAHLAR